MNIEELLSLNPTISEYTSEQMIVQIVEKEEWRCYSATTCSESKELAERYLRFHARIPGLAVREIKATRPVDVFYATDGTASIKGGLFLNGAVVIASNPGKPHSISLFIDDAVAQKNHYPNEGYIYAIDDHEGSK